MPGRFVSAGALPWPGGNFRLQWTCLLKGRGHAIPPPGFSVDSMGTSLTSLRPVSPPAQQGGQKRFITRVEALLSLSRF